MFNQSLPQHRRFQGPREHKKVRQEVSRRQEQNLTAAKIILATPEAHGGEQAGLVRWARLFIKRAEPEVAENVKSIAQIESGRPDRQTALFEHAEYPE